MASLKNSNLFQAWLVLVLAVVFGTALAAVQAALGPKIEDNKLKETLERIPALILGREQAEKIAQSGTELDILQRTIVVDKQGIRKFYSVYDVHHKDGTPLGLVAKASGQGYADKIELLVGLDSGADTITGIFILDQKETPGLGNRIIENEWLGQFNNKSASQRLSVVKGRGGRMDKMDEIDAISGATISSRSVTAIVNLTVSDVKSGQKMPEAPLIKKVQVKGDSDG